MSADPQSPTSIRLDKWLWFARFCKSRALAQKLIERGQISINGQKAHKPSASVRVGDKLVAVLGPVKRTVVVKDVGERRGAAPEAQRLYDEPHPPERLHRDDQGVAAHKAGPLLKRAKGAGRPTKKDRRAIDRFYEDA
ncbi:MAG: RNA-binding S4 domain-containing protein [Rhodospirillaceae bacterium]|nr:RNA-binding S4 domain-containing protein [Rhodospirillaceae bacterium]